MQTKTSPCTRLENSALRTRATEAANGRSESEIPRILAGAFERSERASSLVALLEQRLCTVLIAAPPSDPRPTEGFSTDLGG